MRTQAEEGEEGEGKKVKKKGKKAKKAAEAASGEEARTGCRSKPPAATVCCGSSLLCL